MDEIALYTDGACSGNPGPGGWGAILIYPDQKKEMSGFAPETTNNRMELTAVIQGLAALNGATKKVTIYSDSKYIVDANNLNWLDNWQRNNWQNAAKKPVANRDLWEQLIQLNNQYHPKYVWVKGHSTNQYNNRCDEMAVSAIKNNLN